MEILNKNGMILMDYRREFKRHYADSVDDALKEAILTLYREGQIPEKLFRIILDDSIDDSVVYTYLLSRREFTKSSMELNSEFNEVREKVNDYLIKINFVKNVCTKNSVNTNRIYIIKQYDIPKELLLSYFGLTPAEIIPLMKRKGFMDKFCVLRLSQAFKEIYSELKVPEHIDHGYSLIYYNKLIQGFSIDYKYMVSINYINDPARLQDVVDKIKELDAVVEKQFETKMSYSYFRQLSRKMPITELAAEIEKIVVPVRSGKRSQDIRRPELIVDEVAPTTNPASVSNIRTIPIPQQHRKPILVVDEEENVPVKHTSAKDSSNEQQAETKKETHIKPKDNVTPTVAVQSDVKPEVKPESKPEVKPEQKPEVKIDIKPDKQDKGEQKQGPRPNEQKPVNQNKPQNQGKNNNQPKNDKGGKPQQNQQNQQNKNDQRNGNNKSNEQKPKGDIQEPKGKPEQKKPEPQKNEGKKNDVIKDKSPVPPVQQKEEVAVEKPAPKKKVADDEDDFFDDVIVSNPKPKKDNKSDGGKPMLVMDDSDLDLI